MTQALLVNGQPLSVAGAQMAWDGHQDPFDAIQRPWVDASVQYPTMFDPVGVSGGRATFLPTHVSTAVNDAMIGHHLIYKDIGISDNFEVGCQWIINNDERLIGQVMPAAFIDPDGGAMEMGLGVTYDISIFNGSVYIQNVFRFDPISDSFDPVHYDSWNPATRQGSKLNLGGVVYRQGAPTGINWLVLRVQNGAMQQFLNGTPLGSPTTIPEWAVGRTRVGIQVVSAKIPIGDVGLSGQVVTEIIPDLAGGWYWRELEPNDSLNDMGVAWDHSWDANDAALYTPSAQEQTAFGITATPRVQTIADGDGSKPLTRDTTTYGTVFGAPRPLPGPQFIPYSQRFRRAAVKFDQVFTGPNLYAMLSPQITPFTSGEYFNPTGGFTPPYWCAILCRLDSTPGGAMDSILGSDATISAGPTISYGSQIPVAGTDWSFACWYDPGSGIKPDGVVRSGHTQSANETVLLILSMAEGALASAMQVYWRDAAGVIQSASGVGTVSAAAPSMRWRELFFGWIDEHSYLSAVAVKDAAITAGDITNVVAWATPWLVPTGAEPSEP